MLNKYLCDNKEALYISRYFANKSKFDENDAISAINLVNQLHNLSDVEDIIHKAYVMCRYMRPDIEDVVAMLIYKYTSSGAITKTGCKNTFTSNRGEEYYEYSKISLLAVRGMLPDETPLDDEGNPIYTKDECIEIHIMHRVCDKMYKNLGTKMKRFHNAFVILDAYRIAKEAHYWIKRTTGEPYITHPLMVADILADFGVESPVVAAAILYDMAEDTEITIEQIEEKCGKQISQYVNAVTSLHREYERIISPEDRTKDKLRLDKESFDRLVDMVESCRHMIFALYIKAADRIHTLRTMDTMSAENKRKKTDETDTFYLPLLRRFNLHYFTNIIEDLIWCIDNPELYYEINTKYNDLRNRNQAQVKSTIKLIKSLLDDEFDDQCYFWAQITGFEFSFSEHYYSPLEINKLLKQARNNLSEQENDKDLDIDITKCINKNFLPICDVDVVLDPKDTRCEINSFSTVFIKACAQSLYENGRVITDFTMDEFNRFIVSIEDNCYNVIRFCFSMREDYVNFLNGSNTGLGVKDIISEDAENIPGKITVKLRNGRKIRIESDATVLDLAFRIHEEVGLAATGAKINNLPASIFSPLHDEDTVIVIADTYRKDGLTEEFKSHAEFEWFNHVTTKKAKEILVNYFEGKYK